MSEPEHAHEVDDWSDPPTSGEPLEVDPNDDSRDDELGADAYDAPAEYIDHDDTEGVDGDGDRLQ